MKALDRQKLKLRFSDLAPQQVFDTAHTLSKWIAFHYIRDQSDDSFIRLGSEIPLVNEVINIDLLQARLLKFDSFKRSDFGVHISEFAPEYLVMRDMFIEQVLLIPQGIEKAKYWLRSMAREAGANAYVEAAIYLASRGNDNEVIRNKIEREWYSEVCKKIASDHAISNATRKRAVAKSITLSEAASILNHNYYGLDRFFYFRDDEEDHIDAAMFRAVEWCDISGYDPWLQSFTHQLTQDSIGGVDPDMIATTSWYLFFWCCSDLALNMADRTSLQTFLWVLVNSSYNKIPWQVWQWERGSNTRYLRNYLPSAAIFSFIWSRIRPSNIVTKILDEAISLIEATQLKSGGWPNYQDESEASVLATCTAIHALTIHRPSGWKRLTERAADWLENQQSEEGYWDIGGSGPLVRITVLVLDSIDLARGSDQVTFRLSTDEKASMLAKIGTEILNFQERNDVVKCLMGFPDLIDTPSRQAFLASAGLGFLAPDLDISGPPKDFTARMVDLAERSGNLPKEPQMHCLGALLYLAQSLKHVPLTKRSMLANLILKYGLVDDVKAEKLRTRPQF